LSAEKDRLEISVPDEARREVEKLVLRFQRNRDVYTRPDYKETQVRVEFIDPFFEALGWDVRNVQGYAETYKDVVHEDAIKVSGATRAPDYCFRVGGVRKFFLEAKKPSTPVEGDVGPAYQLRGSPSSECGPRRASHCQRRGTPLPRTSVPCPAKSCAACLRQPSARCSPERIPSAKKALVVWSVS
jgi:hypothetical protein